MSGVLRVSGAGDGQALPEEQQEQCMQGRERVQLYWTENYRAAGNEDREMVKTGFNKKGF